MARRKPEPKPSAADSLERARAATERAQSKLDKKGTSGEDEWDFRRAPLSEWRARWDDKSVRRLFIENFIKVRSIEDQKKVVPLVFNDMQDDLWHRLTGKDVILKMRKGGSSTLQLAIKFSNAVVLSGRNFRVFAHNPKTEAKFRRDLRTMYQHLPAHLKPRAEQFTQEVIEFQDSEKGTLDSIITTTGVQPGFEDNPRGDTITDVLASEMPFWRGDPSKAMTAILEACTPDADVSIESTAGGIEGFHGYYQDGRAGKGGWRSHFYEWWWHRGYREAGATFEQVGRRWILLRRNDALGGLKSFVEDVLNSKAVVTSAERKVAARILLHLINRGYVPKGTKWHAPEVAEYLAWRRSKIDGIGERKFAVEYPENDKDCFTQTGRPLVRADYLKTDGCKPEGAREGHTYLIAADTSLGLQSGDPAAIQVLDVDTGRQCKEVSLTVAPDLLGVTLAALSDEYNGAQIVVERNGPGIATIIKLIELGYEDRLYKHLDARKRRAVEDGRLDLDEAMRDAQYGFPTGADNKPVLGVKLEEGIRTGDLGLSSEEFCVECKTVVWFDDRSWGALPGYHDDRVMALAIGWYVARTQMGLTGFMGVMPVSGEAR
jgi:hypothetical protein